MFNRTVHRRTERDLRELYDKLCDHAHHRIAWVRVTMEPDRKSGSFITESKTAASWIIDNGKFIHSKTVGSLRIGDVRQSPGEGECHFHFMVEKPPAVARYSTSIPADQPIRG
jgi:hypothetical protein